MTYIGIDENPLQDSLTSIRLLKKHSNRWKITYAGNLHEELHIVRSRLRLRKDIEVKKGLEELDRMLRRFTYDAVQVEPAAETVNAARRLLFDLTKIGYGEE